MRKLLSIALLPLALSNCALLAVGAVTETGVSTVEERTYGTKLDDNGTYINVNDQFVKSGHDGLVTAVTVSVRHGRVMLTGNVESESLKQIAGQAASKAKGAKEVINELIVNPDSSYADAANNLLIKKNLDARLYLTKDVWKINYSTDVVANTAYLIGRTKDREELNRVLNVARTTKGVKKVVSHLQVTSEMPDDGTSNPASTSQAAPVASVNSSPAPAAEQAPAPISTGPTDSTVPNAESIGSSDLSAPTGTPAPASAPASGAAPFGAGTPAPAASPYAPATTTPAPATKSPTWR